MYFKIAAVPSIVDADRVVCVYHASSLFDLSNPVGSPDRVWMRLAGDSENTVRIMLFLPYGSLADNVVNFIPKEGDYWIHRSDTHCGYLMRQAEFETLYKQSA